VEKGSLFPRRNNYTYPVDQSRIAFVLFHPVK
jgi:hypothetical protein